MVEANKAVIEYVENNNNNPETNCFYTVFDFTYEEIEETDVNEQIDSFEKAVRFLNDKKYGNAISGWENKNGDPFLSMAYIRNKNVKALVALDKLLIIAEAWNKADGFAPNWNDTTQEKWFPWFKYINKRFVYSSSHKVHNTIVSIPNLYFKTQERAEQFGQQFINLWNEFLIECVS